MQPSATPSFVTEMPLQVGTHEASVLKKRFWAAKQQYNALLGEALKRLTNMRKDVKHQSALLLYKEKGSKTEAANLFKELEKEHGFREYDLHRECKQWNKKGSFLSIGARLSQQLAKRAFKAVKEYQMGKRGRPRFKGYRGLSSIEDNSLKSNFRLKDITLKYLGLDLPLLYNPYDPIHYHGFKSPIKYVRLVKRSFNGRTRYFAQLVCEGTPWVKSKHPRSEGTVGLDIGPQTIAIVSSEKSHAELKVFADELKPLKKEKMRLQQKLSRQLRAANPQCFEKDKWEKKDKHYHLKQGKSLKGKRLLNRPKALQATTAKLSDISRKEAAFRKSQHGRLANEILQLGNYVKTEKLSYKAFQKLFGSSIGLRAPGMFLETLKRKAENAGGRVEEFSTWSTALSQTCHCGKKEKKALKDRWHACPCGVKAQRDLYSAYLANFVKDNQLIAGYAKEAWSGMDIALRTAMSRVKRTSSGPLPTSLGLPGSEFVVRTVS